jgi:formamidopyrimidine-DNA glycosylase
MKAAMVDRRMVTTLPRHRPLKKQGLALLEEVHYVYRRQGRACRVCGSVILTRPLAGRKLFWCPKCQQS